MYPFEPGPHFVEQAWYVAAWAGDVGAAPIARTVLEQGIVLFRGPDGAPVALANRCPHRGLPLVMGAVQDGRLACGYHGFTFDSNGRCTKIPSQERVPPGITVRRYPAVEQWQWIWVWMGDPDAPDHSLLPTTEEQGLDGPPWLALAGGDFAVSARYQLFNENLLDLTHLTFLHGDNIGTPNQVQTQARITADGRRVNVARDTYDEPMSTFYANRFGVAPGGRMDRHHRTCFIAPAFHILGIEIEQGGVTLGRHKILHAITPVTATTLHDYWAIVRTYRQSDEMTAFLRENITRVIEQDIVALEAIEASIDDTRPTVEYSCAADEAALKGRRAVQELLRAQRAAAPREMARA